ncbi:RNA pseudouridine synthase [Altererythrobacter sp. KTW20L]|uniref:RluA family pseudouridine synthase n=1 Tax=Altererythrobacter sp. KTW20L TaxID=2942210 RepID=UPI0020BF9B26|nr:RNA pseudouridine synthase [Altererythrobacter sp. KTW20L]MCL6250169.1 RNA pseudouridine synthase [Altererythrobacter sp. KTW20L]
MSEFIILYEDAEALVIDKPGGLPIDTPRKRGPSIEQRLGELKLGFQREPQPAHRLDTDTSGCLLFARNPKALVRYHQAFEQRLVGKTYLGVLAGIPDQKEGDIDLALTKISSEEKGWRMIPAKKGKPSLTRWRVVAEANGRALVEFTPETGRTHQIRVHAASGIGIPLLGDPVYGTKAGYARTMLHASRLEVARDGKPPIIAEAPMPADFVAQGF